MGGKGGGKRRHSLDPNQLGFTFDTPSTTFHEADLAGLGRVIASGVSRALSEDSRNRYDIAAAISKLLEQDVSKFMLDAYASEARGEHNISAERFLALIAVTDRYDILDRVLRRIGAAALVGEEIMLARAGHLRARQAEISRELREIERKVRPLGREQKD